MNDTLWNEIKRLADQVELKIHLARMDLRTRWDELKPQLAALERELLERRAQARHLVTDRLDKLRAALHQLRDELSETTAQPPAP